MRGVSNNTNATRQYKPILQGTCQQRVADDADVGANLDVFYTTRHRLLSESWSKRFAARRRC